MKLTKEQLEQAKKILAKEKETETKETLKEKKVKLEKEVDKDKTEDLEQELANQKEKLEKLKNQQELAEVNAELAKYEKDKPTLDKDITADEDDEDKEDFTHTPLDIKKQYKARGEEVPSDEDIESRYI